MKNKNNIAFLVLVIFSVVSLFVVLSERNRVERASNKVEMIMEFSEVKSLATNSEYSIDEWLLEFKEMGLQTIALGEQTLSTYITEYGITHESYNDVLNRGDKTFSKYTDKLDDYSKNSLVLYINEKKRAETIDYFLEFYEDLNYITIYEDDTNYIVIDQDKKDVLIEETGDIFNNVGQNIGNDKVYYGTEILNVPIGFDEENVEIIKNSGLSLMLRPSNYSLDAKGAMNVYLSEVEKYGLENKMFFPYGSDLIGYAEEDDYIEEIGGFIVENDMTFALVETMEQRDNYELTGYEDLLPNLTDDTYIRIFNTWPFISNRYEYLNKYEGAEEIANSYYRAITERNIRGVYVRAFSSDNIRMVTEPVEYEKMFNNLEQRLEEHGYSYGLATTYEDISVSLPMKIILTIQVVAFLIVLLNYLLLTVKLKYNLILLAISSVLVALAYYVAPSASTALSAFSSAIIFSVFAATVFIKKCLIETNENNILKSVIYTFLCGLIAMVGGLYIGSLMSSTSYFLEFEYFRGVKLSLVLPMLVIALFTLVFYVKEIYAKKGNNFFNELVETGRNFLDANVKIKYVLALGVVGIVGLIYIMRGGNSSVQPPDIELLMRNILENSFLARPRTKEFLIAFPLMTFATYFAGNKLFYGNKTETSIYIKYSYILVFAVIATVGLSSITNTFSHIRTPLYISVVRTFVGLGLGVVFGLLYIIAFKILIIILMKILSILNKFKGDILDK